MHHRDRWGDLIIGPREVPHRLPHQDAGTRRDDVFLAQSVGQGRAKSQRDPRAAGQDGAVIPFGRLLNLFDARRGLLVGAGLLEPADRLRCDLDLGHLDIDANTRRVAEGAKR